MTAPLSSAVAPLADASKQSALGTSSGAHAPVDGRKTGSITRARISNGSTGAVPSIVVLTPPMQHYGYYDTVRSELFDFYATFHAAAASVGQRTILVANPSRGSTSTTGRGTSFGSAAFQKAIF